MNLRFAFPQYIFTTALYGAIGLSLSAFLITTFIYSLTGNIIWAIFSGIYIALPFAVVGISNGLLVSVLNSIFLHTFSEPSHKEKVYVHLLTTLVVIVVTPIVAIYVMWQFLTYASVTNEPNYIFAFFLASYATIAMLIVHFFALPKVFVDARKVKKMS